MKLAILGVLFFSLFLFGCVQNVDVATEDNGLNVTGVDTTGVSIDVAPVTEVTVGQPVPESAGEVEEMVVQPVNESVSTQSPVREISMTAKQWEFEPSTVTVSQGDRVKLTITSIDVAHGFAIPDLGINGRLEPGQETVVEFDAEQAGTFTFSCSVFCGSGHSHMSGTLVVEEA